MDKVSRKNHKFDVFDVCERCGVERKKVPYVSSGYNMSLVNRFTVLYSLDGENFRKDFIDCKQ